MKREIKFRAWDKLLKKMFNDISFIYIKDSLSYSLYENKTGKYFVSQCYLMQFIGLKDKNGKEIYEGDIIKARFWDREKRKTFQVYFEDGCFFAKSIEMDAFLYELKNMEVLGNIYENPELLNN
jgi:uncharacterized phage protein (TIGR01671 family)